MQVPSPPAARFPGSCLPPSPLSPACGTHRASCDCRDASEKGSQRSSVHRWKNHGPKAKLLAHGHHATCVGQVLCPLGIPGPQSLLPELDTQLPPFLPHLITAGTKALHPGGRPTHVPAHSYYWAEPGQASCVRAWTPEPGPGVDI